MVVGGGWWVVLVGGVGATSMMWLCVAAERRYAYAMRLGWKDARCVYSIQSQSRLLLHGISLKVEAIAGSILLFTRYATDPYSFCKPQHAQPCISRRQVDARCQPSRHSCWSLNGEWTRERNRQTEQLSRSSFFAPFPIVGGGGSGGRVAVCSLTSRSSSRSRHPQIHACNSLRWAQGKHSHLRCRCAARRCYSRPLPLASAWRDVLVWMRVAAGQSTCVLYPGCAENPETPSWSGWKAAGPIMNRIAGEGLWENSSAILPGIKAEPGFLEGVEIAHLPPSGILMRQPPSCAKARPHSIFSPSSL